MKFTMAQGPLFVALQAVQKGSVDDPARPIYAGVLVDASDGVRFETTDSNTSIRHVAPANVEEPGAMVLPAKLLLNTVKSMPDSAVTISSEGTQALIKCGRTRVRMNTIPATEFPEFPTVEPDQQCAVPAQILSTLVGHASRCISKDQSRPILAGIHVTLENGMLTCSSTDSYRMCDCKSEVGDGEFEAVIPGTQLKDAIKGASGDVILGVSDSQALVTAGRTTWVMRKIEGQFPNMRQLIPNSFSTRATMDADDLHTVVSRVSVVCESNPSIVLNVSDNQLDLFANSPDQGEASESMPVDSEGPEMTIALNNKFLSDAVNGISGDIALCLNGSAQPAIIRAYGDMDLTYLVMPVRL